MTETTGICAAILAAGQSKRFGDQDKLAAKLNGKMLGLHAAETVASLGLSKVAVVVSPAQSPCIASWSALGFDIIVNNEAAQGMGSSVAHAAQFASKCNADGLLVCLADMPFISAPLLDRLTGAFEENRRKGAFAASNEDVSLPPAIFGAEKFPELALLSGAQGARQLLSTATAIPATSREIADIDHVTELDRWNDHRNHP
ncbi:nucleotidyltransferase family protein [Parasphingorhabdus sp.]|uniref:nucleotidyltransferase family protein n=1 Tax=Parasphingorhabdus sp. TaxID=2709688 RepID=UPI003264C5FD